MTDYTKLIERLKLRNEDGSLGEITESDQLQAANAIEDLQAENERLKYEAMFEQHYTEPVDVMFFAITQAARVSYARAKSQAVGQVTTWADDYEAHLVWAAQAYQKNEIERLKQERDQLQAKLDEMQRQQPWMVEAINEAHSITKGQQ